MTDYPDKQAIVRAVIAAREADPVQAASPAPAAAPIAAPAPAPEPAPAPKAVDYASMWAKVIQRESADVLAHTRALGL